MACMPTITKKRKKRKEINNNTRAIEHWTDQRIEYSKWKLVNYLFWKATSQKGVPGFISWRHHLFKTDWNLAIYFQSDFNRDINDYILSFVCSPSRLSDIFNDLVCWSHFHVFMKLNRTKCVPAPMTGQRWACAVTSLALLFVKVYCHQTDLLVPLVSVTGPEHSIAFPLIDFIIRGRFWNLWSIGWSRGENHGGTDPTPIRPTGSLNLVPRFYRVAGRERSGHETRVILVLVWN